MRAARLSEARDLRPQVSRLGLRRREAPVVLRKHTAMTEPQFREGFLLFDDLEVELEAVALEALEQRIAIERAQDGFQQFRVRSQGGVHDPQAEDARHLDEAQRFARGEEVVNRRADPVALPALV